MKAVIYARYSSDSQREESIEGQLRECTEYAERNGITILRSYIDRALSARTADRPEFQNMIKDSEQKLFDVVLIWKLDRFSRDRYDSAHYKRILKKNGVKVVSVKENISDGPEGIILESMLEGYAEYYSAELSEKIQRGQKENALKCKNNGGNTPLGYVVGADGVLAVDPLTAPLVTEIFTRYDSGESISEITASLNGRGLKTKKGKAFKIGGVSLILKNRKYIGEYQYGSVIIPKGIPAIIDDDLFDRVQRRMAFNKKAPAKAKATEEYLLTTKLFCGTCERLMAGESGTSSTKGVKHYYYKCGGAKRKLGCKRKAVRKHWIERAAVLVTVQRVLQDDEISRIAEAIVALQEKEDTSLPAMRQQLTECEKAIDNMLNAIQMGVLTASTKERLEKLEMQREELKLSILQAQMARPRYTKEQVVSWISRFKYGNVDDPQYQKQIIDTFINSIYVFDDKLVFTYNFKDGTETITLAEIQAAFGSDLTQVAPPKRADTLMRVCSFWRSAVCAADRTPFFIRVHTPLGLDSPLWLSQLPDVRQHAFAEAGDAEGELLAGVQAHAELAADAGADRQGLDARELAADHHLRHHRDAEPLADHADDGLVVHIAGADNGLDAVFPERRADVDIEPAVGHQKFLARKGLDGEKVPPVCRIVRGEDGVHRVVVQRRPVAGEAALPGGEDHVRLPFFQQLKRLELMVDRPQVHVDMRADAAEAV